MSSFQSKTSSAQRVSDAASKSTTDTVRNRSKSNNKAFSSKAIGGLDGNMSDDDTESDADDNESQEASEVEVESTGDDDESEEENVADADMSDEAYVAPADAHVKQHEDDNVDDTDADESSVASDASPRAEVAFYERKAARKQEKAGKARNGQMVAQNMQAEHKKTKLQLEKKRQQKRKEAEVELEVDEEQENEAEDGEEKLVDANQPASAPQQPRQGSQRVLPDLHSQVQILNAHIERLEDERDRALIDGEKQLIENRELKERLAARDADSPAEEGTEAAELVMQSGLAQKRVRSLSGVKEWSRNLRTELIDSLSNEPDKTLWKAVREAGDFGLERMEEDKTAPPSPPSSSNGDDDDAPPSDRDGVASPPGSNFSSPDHSPTRRGPSSSRPTARKGPHPPTGGKGLGKGAGKGPRKGPGKGPGKTVQPGPKEDTKSASTSETSGDKPKTRQNRPREASKGLKRPPTAAATTSTGKSANAAPKAKNYKWTQAEKEYIYTRLQEIVNDEGITGEERFDRMADDLNEKFSELYMKSFGETGVRNQISCKNKVSREIRQMYVDRKIDFDDRKPPKDGSKRNAVTSARASFKKRAREVTVEVKEDEIKDAEDGQSDVHKSIEPADEEDEPPKKRAKKGPKESVAAPKPKPKKPTAVKETVEKKTRAPRRTVPAAKVNEKKRSHDEVDDASGSEDGEIREAPAKRSKPSPKAETKKDEAPKPPPRAPIPSPPASSSASEDSSESEKEDTTRAQRRKGPNAAPKKTQTRGRGRRR